VTTKNLFIDLETTGLDYDRCAVVEISGTIEYAQVYEEFSFKSCPFDGAIITDESLEKIGYTEDELWNFPPIDETYRNLIQVFSKHIERYDKFDKFTTYVYGPEFDNTFLRQFFALNSDQYFGSWFWNPWIDVMSLAMKYLAEKRYLMENFKLVTVAEFLGIEVSRGKLHSSLYDVELTKKINNMVEDKSILENAKTPEIIHEETVKRKSKYCVYE